MWRRYYNTVRPHSALGHKPPAPQTIAWPVAAAVRSAVSGEAQKPMFH
jgi:transposase InsO family protein